MLVCRDISLQVGKRIIVNRVSLEVADGEWLAIMGASGSGKSSLLKILSGLQAYTSGSIYWEGQERLDLATCAMTDWRQRIGYCHQLPYLFGRRVEENLAYPYEIRNRPFDRDRAIALLASLKLDASYLEKENSLLSGGEMQRICLVRSLLFPPKVLLVDEVTSALDERNTRLVEDLLQRLNQQGLTILQVTHDVGQSLRGPNRRIVLEQGRIVEDVSVRC